METDHIALQTRKKQALACIQARRFHEARRLYTDICRAYKHDSEAWSMLAAANGMLGHFDETISCCLRSLDINSNQPDVHFNLAQAYMYQHKFFDAVNSYREVIRALPDHIDAYKNMGNALQAQGLINEATACYRTALQLQPDNTEIHSNLLLSLNYNPANDAASVFTEHARWGNTHGQSSAPVLIHPNQPDPDRTLRVGYMSPDLRTHSVSYFIEPLLAQHNPAEVKATCFIDVTVTDDTTSRISGLAIQSHDISGKTDEQVAELIRNDEIDILVDLAGHTANNRLPLFTKKPAPVQVTYLGYPNTTGLTAMDYRITDAWADPPGETERWHTETLIRIPGGFLCYKPPPWAPPVAPPPAAINGFITFGSFNNLSKVTSEAVSLWANILHTVPESRLVIKSKSFRDNSTRDHYQRLFAGHGIKHSRLDLVAYINQPDEHLAYYNHIDIALDTFPYNGTTTTCEALWMGVPVLAISGQTHASRVGASLLSQVGLTELIAENPDDCISRAVSLVDDEGMRLRLRQQLRNLLADSSLCDGESFTRKIEDAYRNMWRKWCEAHIKE